MTTAAEVRTILLVILALLCGFAIVKSLPATAYFLTRPLRCTPAGRLVLWVTSVASGVVMLRVLLGPPVETSGYLWMVAVAIFGRIGFDLYTLRRTAELHLARSPLPPRT